MFLDLGWQFQPHNNCHQFQNLEISCNDIWDKQNFLFFSKSSEKTEI